MASAPSTFPSDAHLYGQVISILISQQAIRVTKYLSPTMVVKATRKRFQGKVSQRTIDLVVTIGNPNYREREFIRQCQRAGEPFPIRKMQIRPMR